MSRKQELEKLIWDVDVFPSEKEMALFKKYNEEYQALCAQEAIEQASEKEGKSREMKQRRGRGRYGKGL